MGFCSIMEEGTGRVEGGREEKRERAGVKKRGVESIVPKKERKEVGKGKERR